MVSESLLTTINHVSQVRPNSRAYTCYFQIHTVPKISFALTCLSIQVEEQSRQLYAKESSKIKMLYYSYLSFISQTSATAFLRKLILALRLLIITSRDV